jgi:hypothetical protein
MQSDVKAMLLSMSFYGRGDASNNGSCAAWNVPTICPGADEEIRGM